jgi:predicted secreted Zn-dependent protease
LKLTPVQSLYEIGKPRSVRALRRDGHTALSRRRLALALGLLLAASSTQGQIYRCDRDGAVAYSDRPCEAGAKSRSKTYAATGPSGSLDLQVNTVHYDVRGHDYPSLVRSLRANGPQGFHGLARWNVAFDYNMEPRGPDCAISAVRVRVAGEILMPRWVDAESAPLALQRRWSDHYAALQRHEEGHIQHGRELALLTKERLMGLGAMDCDRLKTLARDEFQRLHANLKARDKEYDARTNHGATQGARF